METDAPIMHVYDGTIHQAKSEECRLKGRPFILSFAPSFQTYEGGPSLSQLTQFCSFGLFFVYFKISFLHIVKYQEHGAFQANILLQDQDGSRKAPSALAGPTPPDLRS